MSKKQIESAKNPAAVALGRLGGSVKSEAKRLACIANAKLPRPSRKKSSNSSKAIENTGENKLIWPQNYRQSNRHRGRVNNS